MRRVEIDTVNWAMVGVTNGIYSLSRSSIPEYDTFVIAYRNKLVRIFMVPRNVFDDAAVVAIEYPQRLNILCIATDFPKTNKPIVPSTDKLVLLPNRTPR